MTLLCSVPPMLLMFTAGAGRQPFAKPYKQKTETDQDASHGLTVKPNSLSARIPTRGAPQAAMAPSKERSKAYICALHVQI